MRQLNVKMMLIICDWRINEMIMRWSLPADSTHTKKASFDDRMIHQLLSQVSQVQSLAAANEL